jgi:hypothetical protein
MQSLKMKIVEFNPLNGILSIKFASDNAEKKIEEYPSHQFNVVEMHENVKLDEILKALAQNGWNIAFQQEAAEEIVRNNVKINIYKNLVGNEFSYTQQELFSQEASENQPNTDGLMIV